ncbi:Twin-arginine translocation protein TatC [Microbacterium esteraromaticum]|uniref:Sec-independent protein translocase protein TatC n=2 Tax=Microbacterium esteraromaticum TaxID=57043 RepID=A0A1R4IQH8_9MICO|nr:Twin-arginine translocation protein TatC [Microbacterium esteraromaticum]
MEVDAQPQGTKRDRRMSLGGHLREARNRLIIAVIGLAVGMVVAFIATDAIIAFITEPIHVLDAKHGTDFAKLMFSTVSEAFNLRLRIAFAIGLLLSAPIWLWQVWAFIMPGLTRKEISYTIWFLVSAIPLFFAGVYVAIIVAPHVIEVMSNFVPENAVNYFKAAEYYDFIFKFVIVIGVSFVLPVFMVALNLAGVITGRAIVKGWRVAVLISALFAAIATPAADIFSMLMLAGILIVLYFAAGLLSMLFDRRKRKRTIAAGLDPDVSTA